MRARPLRALGFLVAAGLSYAAFDVGSEWADGYLMQYGTFVLSRGEVAFRLHLLLFVLPATVFLAAALADLPFSARLLAAFDALVRPRRVWPWGIALAIAVAALAVVVRVGVLRATALTDDENVYAFQARLLASGQLYAESVPEPVRRFFDNQFIVNNGRWFGTYFLGHPAVLAAGLRLGASERVGAIQAALTLLLAVGIARRIGGSRVAILTGLLLALSPFFVFVSATQLSQPTSALMLAVVVYAALRIEGAPRGVGWWALLGAALCFGVLVRPQTGLFLPLPLLARLGYLMARGRLRTGWAPPGTFALVCAAGAAVFFGINHALTGNALRTSYQAYWDLGHTWPFPWGPYYTVREISQNLAHLNFWLFGWPLSLCFVPFFRREPATWTLAAIPAVAVVWYGIPAIPTVAAVGPVYYAELIAPLAVLSASGIERTITLVRERAGEGFPTRALAAWPCAAALASLAAFVPVHVASLRLMADIARAPYDLVEERRLDKALVFVHSLPALHTRPGAWVYYHRNPSPDLSDRVLFVRDLGPEKNKDLMAYLPDRAPYAMGMRDGRLTLLPLRP